MLSSSGCAKAPEPIVVGSQSATGQVIVGEIVAQHLEHGLGRKIQRRLGIGGELTVYQELLTRQISLYPAFTGSIETEILKEPPSSDPGVVWERSRGEMDRLSKLELLNPLGYENPPAMVVRAIDAENLKLTSLSQAAAATTKWKIGTSYEFQQRIDGVPAISGYRLPLAQVMRGMEASELFPALQRGDVTMITVDSIDGRLTSPDYRVLTDDKHAFAAQQACLLVRQDLLAAEPRMRAVLAELSGKFTTAVLRKMSAEVDLDHREPADVAREFLAQTGLK
jgi:osmoprotectant transport system substrate-binding protein